MNSRTQGVAATITSLLLLTHVRAHSQSQPEPAQSPGSNSGVTSPIKSQPALTGEAWFDSNETDLPPSAATARPEPAPAPQPVPFAQQFPETSRPLTNAAVFNASPQPKVNSFSDHTIQLQAVVGFGTIVGLAGATVGVNLGERINVGGGMGANLLGLQLAGYCRLRPFVWQIQAAPDHVGALALELAYVRGPSRGVMFGGGFQGEQPDYSWKFVQWAQFGVFYEKIISTRFVTLIGGSLAFPIASSDCSATASDGSYIACDSTNKPKPLIGFTYAIGPAF
jgi:hypothetical protein